MIAGICIVILALLLGLSMLSGKEQGNLLERMSMYLYKLCCIYKVPVIETGQVGADLERLHPNVSKRELQMDYYVEKLQLFLVVLTVGTILTLLLSLKIGIENSKDAQSLERGEVGTGEQELVLTAYVGEQQEEIQIELIERQLESKELEGLFQQCAEELKDIIPGENEGLEEVTENLLLPEELEGYPFEIAWKSSDFTLIDTDGELENIEGRRGETVCLTAVLYYGEIKYEQDYLVEIGSRSNERTLKERLKEALWEKDEESKYETRLPLPEILDGETITWRILREDNSVIFLGLTIITSVGVFFLKDKDLHEKMLERKKHMKMAYPGILNKFVLYMGAGMTVRGSFFKITMDYQKNTRKEDCIICEELMYSCNELNAGVSEGLVYEHFGKRSGLQEYARFTTMLGQNLKKGNSALLMRLREETDKAMQENLQYRKKIGEEAETKLLVPMIMMMGIVMLLVMLPAFSSF